MSESARPTTIIQTCLDRIRGGDLGAREPLIRHTCQRLETLARQMLRANPRIRRWEETGDLQQTAVLRLYRALEHVQPTTVADFFRLAALHMRQALIDMARRHFGPQGEATHHQSASLTSAQLGSPIAEVDSDPAILAAWSDFHEAVERLDADHRTVVELLWYHGLSQPEASELLGIPLRTLQRRWRTARVLLGPYLPAGDGGTSPSRPSTGPSTDPKNP